MDDRLSATLEVAFPDRSVLEVAETGPSWNDRNETVAVSFTDGRAYLKLAVDDDPTRLRRERGVLCFLEDIDSVPTPIVLGADFEPPGSAAPYMVTAPVDGYSFLECWDEPDADRECLARGVGRTLARVHEVPLEAHQKWTDGNRAHAHIVDGDGNRLTLEPHPWTAVLIDTIENARSRASTQRFDHHYDLVIDALRAKRNLLEEAPATLVHGDPAMPNAFVAPGGRVGLLDWEIAHVGDPVRDIVRTRTQQFDQPRQPTNERLVTAFHDGYRDVAGTLPDGYHSRRPIYEAVRLLGISGFFDKWVVYAEADETTAAAWLEDTLERRLAALNSLEEG